MGLRLLSGRQHPPSNTETEPESHQSTWRCPRSRTTTRSGWRFSSITLRTRARMIGWYRQAIRTMCSRSVKKVRSGPSTFPPAIFDPRPMRRLSVRATTRAVVKARGWSSHTSTARGRRTRTRRTAPRDARRGSARGSTCPTPPVPPPRSAGAAGRGARPARAPRSFEQLGGLQPAALDVLDLALDALQLRVQLHQLRRVRRGLQQRRVELLLLRAQLVQLALQPAQFL